MASKKKKPTTSRKRKTASRKRSVKKTAQEWCEPTNLALIQGWTRDGATMTELAEKMHITRKTLYSWRNDYPKIDKAVKQGKEAIDYAVESSLLKKALSGDTKAMIFWLQNRKPEKWRKKTQAEVELRQAQYEQAKAQAAIQKAQAEQVNTAGDEMIKQMRELSTEDLRLLANSLKSEPDKKEQEDDN